MKNTRNLWRVVTLALAMIMLFSVVACQNGGTPAQTTEGKADGTTLAPTTEKPTTEKPATQKPTTEKPATTPAPTTTPEPTEAPKVEVDMESTFGGTYTFSNYLPEAFAAADAILLAGKDHLESDLGVSSLDVSGITHYYINLNEAKDDAGNVIDHADKSLTWKFTVPADGTYDFCFQMRMKDGAQRGNVVQIDDGEKTSMDFQFKDGAEATIRDDLLNSYMTGYSAYLTAGEHTIKMTYAPECPKTFHFRNIYVAKRPEPAKQTFVAENFSATLPEAFAAAGVITIAGADHAATDVNVTPLEQTYTVDGAEVKITHYYLKYAEGNCLTWTVEIPVTGDYDFCYNFRLKDDKHRFNIIQIDDQLPTIQDFQLTKDEVATLKDACENSYVTGFSAFLTEGTHTIKMYVTEDMASTFHFRNIYLLAQAPETTYTYNDSNFSAELPAAFAGDNVIKVDMKAPEANSEILEVNATQYKLINFVDPGTVSAHGITAYDPSGTGLYHYYVDATAKQFQDENGVGPNWYQAYIRWSVEIPADGTYAVCFQFRLKNNAHRFTILQIDDAQVKDMIAMDYTIAGDVNTMKDSLENAYLTGLQLELTKGTHTLTFRVPKADAGSWHFRNIYLIKVA